MADPGASARTGFPATGRTTDIFRRTVGETMTPPTLLLPRGTDCGLAVARMAALASSCAVIVDGEHRPVGLLTDQDVARRIAFQVPPGTPVELVMNRVVPCVPAGDRLLHAVARMRRRGLRHLIVTDDAGRAAGLLDLDVALAATADSLVRRMDRLSRDGSIAGMTAAKVAQRDIARDLLAEHVPAVEIQALLTEIDRDLYGQILDNALAAMAEEGWGKPPVGLCVLLMGSGGRGECFLAPDQDNGFILADYPDAAHGAIDRFFVELAERLTRDLDAIGIPYCKGGVMATNPLWRKTQTQWRDQVGLWARRRSGGATLLADIFFDFQPIYGDTAMAETLRAHVSAMASQHRALLQSMAHDDSGHAVALNLFGRLSTAGAASVHRGRIELKIHGRQPLVGCVRLLALAAGVAETSTLRRLARLGALGALAQTDVDDLVDAHHHIAELTLRQQIADLDAGRVAGDHVEVEKLTAQERARLHAALRAIDRLRKRVQIDLLGGGA